MVTRNGFLKILLRNCTSWRIFVPFGPLCCVINESHVAIFSDSRKWVFLGCYNFPKFCQFQPNLKYLLLSSRVQGCLRHVRYRRWRWHQHQGVRYCDEDAGPEPIKGGVGCHHWGGWWGWWDTVWLTNRKRILHPNALAFKDDWWDQAACWDFYFVSWFFSFLLCTIVCTAGAE